MPQVYVGLTDQIHKINLDWNIKINTTSFVQELSIEVSREWMVRGPAHDRVVSYEYLSGRPEPINGEIIF